MNTGVRAVYLTGFGFIANQIADYSKNRVPAEITEDNIIQEVTRGYMRGGGVGIAGDLIFGNYNQYGKDIFDYIGGPTGSVIKSMFENKGKVAEAGRSAYELLGGEPEGDTLDLEAGDAIDLLDNAMSFGDLWYTKAARKYVTDKYLRDNFDKDYDKKRRKEESRLREKGQKHWVDK